MAKQKLDLCVWPVCTSIIYTDYRWSKDMYNLSSSISLVSESCEPGK